ncbi:Uncharacterised protein [Legionella sainthelensi]|uniref:Uncharacterized protein n=1 Tax=Legionella sainthelensi TaxID=28087 RepID=A0A2H5FJM3_9GAMM|nr:hypothetical protein [Legionella sainthelensi]AUH71741.1 hypothetical protein CAB17_06430 [Legionella sainthelensi]VEB33442.1 Uncharacterised protein [Legionella sainthelensi]
MNRLILALMMVGSLLLVTGCVTERVYYTPTYTPQYAYSVGYYHTSPYWNIDYFNNDVDAYYYGYDDLGDVGYWGMYDTYQVY